MKLLQLLTFLLLTVLGCSTPVTIASGLQATDQDKAVEVKMLRADRDGDSMRVVLVIKNLTEDRGVDFNLAGAVLFAEGETLAQYETKPADFAGRRPARVYLEDSSVVAFANAAVEAKNPQYLVLPSQGQQTRVLIYTNLPLDFAPLEIQLVHGYNVRNPNSTTGKLGKLVIPLKSKP